MKLYHTTTKKLEKGQTLVSCTSQVCRFNGLNDDHICFTTEPQQGDGEWVYEIDLPVEKVFRFECKDIFRRGDVRRYALPRLLVEKARIKRMHFSETGQEWNRFRVLLRHEERNNLWGLVWLSRLGIATAKVIEQNSSPEYMLAEIVLTPEFDPTRDYVIFERHETDRTEWGKPKDKWQLELLAGVMPNWAIFPWAWMRWVNDEDVRDSSVAYLLHHFPDLEDDIRFAQRRDSRANIARAWRIIADQLSRRLNHDLGKFPGHSWTAVQAIPIRIAQRVGEVIGQPWRPPKPKPEYENPEESNRVLLANQYGVYPKRGPGVDHSPIRGMDRREEGDGSQAPFREFVNTRHW